MPEKKKLPVGIDNFEKIIKNNFYYVDKTEMIHSLIRNWSEVNLFTRPRRFDKFLKRKYAAKLEDDGMRSVIKYGIACYKKDCRVVIGTS